MNWGPQSVTIFTGIPWILTTFRRTISYFSSYFSFFSRRSLGKAMKCAALEKRSTTTKTTGLPSDTGKPVIKFMAIWDQGRSRIGRWCRWPARRRLEDFCWAQTGQACTKAQIFFDISGHQNRRWTKSKVLSIPECPARGEVWPHLRTLDLVSLGTNKHPVGTSSGIYVSCSASRT